MVLNKQLILIDDSHRGFWRRIGKEHWEENAWPEYSISKLDGNDFTEISRVVVKIEELAESGDLYIVTDGHLWDDSEGGSKLLKEAMEITNFQCGVVYSSDPKLSNELAKADTIIAVTRDSAEEDIQQIKRFFATGRKPSAYVLDEKVCELSTAIHRLENLALPLKLDIETLQSSGADSKTVAEVFRDYFHTEDPIGYLLPNKTFPEGRVGLEREAVDILAATGKLDAKAGGNLLEPYRDNGELSPSKVSSEWSLDVVRNDAIENCDDREWLTEALKQVAAKIGELAEQIRAVRKAAVEQRKAHT